MITKELIETTEKEITNLFETDFKYSGMVNVKDKIEYKFSPIEPLFLPISVSIEEMEELKNV